MADHPSVRERRELPKALRRGLRPAALVATVNLQPDAMCDSSHFISQAKHL